MEDKEKKYKVLMIKSELKDELDMIMLKIGKKLSYSGIIKFIIEEYKNKK